MRHAFTRIELLVVITIVLLLCVCCLPDAGEEFYAILFGWTKYPLRLGDTRVIDWPNTFLCLACLAGLTVGVHLFGRWFAAQRSAPTDWPWSRTLKLVGFQMLMFVAGIMAIGVTHEVYWLATSEQPLRERAADRTVSGNNLRQIGTGVHTYHGIHTHLPLGGNYDAQGRGMHGWQTILLPYMEQQPLYNSIDLKQPWNAPANARAMSVEVMAYQHPSIDLRHADGFGLSHYAGNVHVLGPALMKFGDIADGTSQTILAGEVSSNFKPWGHPATWRDPALGLHKSPDGFGGPTPNVTQFLMADASVRKMRNDANPAVLKAFATPNGGEKDAWD